MTKKQLEKLKKLMKEAEHLKAKLEKPASLREMVIDSVKTELRIIPVSFSGTIVLLT